MEYKLGRYRGKFCAICYEGGKRRRHSLRTTDRREAERRLRHLQMRVPERTVEALWQAYVMEKEGQAVLETMVHTWKQIGTVFGHLDPSTIDVMLCRSYTASRRAKGIRDATIRTELGHLRTVLNWAVKRGQLQRAPHIERPPHSRNQRTVT